MNKLHLLILDFRICIVAGMLTAILFGFQVLGFSIFQDKPVVWEGRCQLDSYAKDGFQINCGEDKIPVTSRILMMAYFTADKPSEFQCQKFETTLLRDVSWDCDIVEKAE